MAHLVERVRVTDDITVSVRELTVGEVEQIWELEKEIASGTRVVSLFEMAMSHGAPTFDDIKRVSDISDEQLRALSQSELVHLESEVSRVNPKLFTLRHQQGLLMAAQLTSQAISPPLLNEDMPTSSTTPSPLSALS